MKARARELGFSDTKVAERAGLAQTRYAAYTVDKYEPDLPTLLRICRVLNLSPNELLGWTDVTTDEESVDLRQRIVTNLSVLKLDTLDFINTITLALAFKAINSDK